MTQPAIVATNLRKVFGDQDHWLPFARRPPVAAVRGVSFAVQAGELFGLLGPNGAGKTTLVKILATLVLPSGGEATIAGHALREERKIRQKIGLVVSDERSFYWRLSARQNLIFFASLFGLRGRAAEARADEVLDAVELTANADQRFSDFSSGMKQRLSIARSLLHRPRLLFLDEPSRSLDPMATQRLHSLIRQLCHGQQMTVLLITHNLQEAESLCQRIGLMYQGRLATVGTPAELRSQLRDQRRYEVTVRGLTPPIRRALDQAAPGVQYMPTDSLEHIRFETQPGASTLTTVLDILRQHELEIDHVAGQLPTLDEVFAHFAAASKPTSPAP